MRPRACATSCWVWSLTIAHAGTEMHAAPLSMSFVCLQKAAAILCCRALHRCALKLLTMWCMLDRLLICTLLHTALPNRQSTTEKFILAAVCVLSAQETATHPGLLHDPQVTWWRNRLKTLMQQPAAMLMSKLHFLYGALFGDVFASHEVCCWSMQASCSCRASARCSKGSCRKPMQCSAIVLEC